MEVAAWREDRDRTSQRTLAFLGRASNKRVVDGLNAPVHMRRGAFAAWQDALLADGSDVESLTHLLASSPALGLWVWHDRF
jgi:hypothetical protein